jgi:hypothetical protein
MEYHDHGISHIQVILDPMTVEGIEEFGQVLAMLGRMAPGGEIAERA